MGKQNLQVGFTSSSLTWVRLTIPAAITNIPPQINCMSLKYCANRPIERSDMTPNVPHDATIVPAREEAMSKCDSAIEIPNVSKEEILPLVETFNNIHPRIQQSYTVIPMIVFWLAASSICSLLADFFLFSLGDAIRTRPWNFVTIKNSVIPTTTVMKYAGAVYMFHRKMLDIDIQICL